MTAGKCSRNQAVRRTRRRGMSQRDLAREFGISRLRVRQLLTQGRSDPLLGQLLAKASEHELERRSARLIERIANDLRTLELVEQELEVKRTDRILGLTG